MDVFLSQLRHAQRSKGWSDEELLKRSGLDLDRTSLSRKLNGRTPMTLEEATSLGQALETPLAWTPGVVA